MIKREFRLIGCMLAYLLLIGCAGSKTYLIDLQYLPRKELPPLSALRKVPLVGVVSFTDHRVKKDKIGFRKHWHGHSDLFKSEIEPVKDALTRVVETYFTKRGYKVEKLSSWDHTPESLVILPQDFKLVVAGSIERLWLKAETAITSTTTTYELTLTAYIGQMKEKKILKRTEKRSQETKDLSFSPEDVKKTLNEMLSEIIESLFEGLD